jgi:hypothetical protein
MPGKRRDKAIGVCDAGADGDKREHVEAAIDDRPLATLEERPAAPQHDRSREQELQRHESVRRQET